MNIETTTLKVLKTVFNTEDVMYVKADSNYSTFFTNDGRKIMMSHTLKKFEGMFLRIHKSTLVNKSYIRSINGNIVTMVDGSTHDIPKRRYKVLTDNKAI